VKRTSIAAAILIAVLGAAASGESSGSETAEKEPMTMGLHLLLGGRYDDLRMCVGSPPGVKGGPIGDIYVDFHFPLSLNSKLVLNIPVFRPIMFGAAFSMLQFEPQVTYEYKFPGKSPARPVLGTGLGVIFHYGPDYNSSPEDPGESFFAAGPLFSLSFGVAMPDRHGGFWTPGLKAFVSPLFGEEGRRGLVAGGGVELFYEFAPKARKS